MGSGYTEQLAIGTHHYNWDRSHEAVHGVTPIDRVCERADTTPLHGAVSDAYDRQRSAFEFAITSLMLCYEH